MFKIRTNVEIPASASCHLNPQIMQILFKFFTNAQSSTNTNIVQSSTPRPKALLSLFCRPILSNLSLIAIPKYSLLYSGTKMLNFTNCFYPGPHRSSPTSPKPPDFASIPPLTAPQSLCSHIDQTFPTHPLFTNHPHTSYLSPTPPTT